MSEPYWSALGAAAGGGGYTSGTINAATAASDLAWPAAAVGLSNVFYVTAAAGGGIRSIAAPAAGAGTRVTIYASGTQSLTIKNNSAGGPNVIYMVGSADLVLVPGDVIELMWDATNFWIEVARDKAAGGRASLGLVAQTITDWNNANENGWFMGSGATNGPPALAGAWAIGQVNVHIQNLWMTQRVWNFTDIVGSQSYERRMINGAWGAWVLWPATGPAFVTTLPASPPDGQEVMLVDSLTTPTYGVRMRYVQALARWMCVGDMPWRKVTTKTVNTTVAETDLLNGELTLKANMLGANGLLRLTAWGDYLVNSGAQATPRFKFKLGATTITDMGVSGQTVASANRHFWRVVVELLNYAAASQMASFVLDETIQASNLAGSNYFTTGEGAFSQQVGGSSGSFLVAEGIATAAVNTAVDQAVALSVINGSAAAAVETRLLGALMELR